MPIAAGADVGYGAVVFIEGTLIEKLRKLEALHAGTKVEGEREQRGVDRRRQRGIPNVEIRMGAALF